MFVSKRVRISCTIYLSVDLHTKNWSKPFSRHTLYDNNFQVFFFPLKEKTTYCYPVPGRSYSTSQEGEVAPDSLVWGTQTWCSCSGLDQRYDASCESKNRTSTSPAQKVIWLIKSIRRWCKNIVEWGGFTWFCIYDNTLYYRTLLRKFLLYRNLIY